MEKAEKEFEEEIKKAENDLLDVISTVSMLCFQKILLKEVRKEILDTTLEKTIKEVDMVIKMWYDNITKGGPLPFLVECKMRELLFKVKGKATERFKKEIYQSYVDELNIIDIDKKFTETI